MSLAPGTRVGPYELVERLGSGGMGEVFEARDSRLNRSVALKFPRVEFTNRVEREARAIAALNHPNICTLHDIGPDYLVLELVEGETLAERIARAPVPIDEAIRIARQIAAALHAAHSRGIIHRDLKPANIKIKPDGMVKVLDFGLARLLDPGYLLDPETATGVLGPVTLPGEVIGTPAYMSAEQAQGHDLDARTDIWSLGVILYEMLTGRRPFDGGTARETVAAILSRPLPPHAGATRQLQGVIDRSTAKDRNARYSAAADLIRDLDAVAAERLSASQPTPMRRIAATLRRPAVAVPVAVALAAALATSGWSMYRKSWQRWARSEAIPQAWTLVESGDYRAAYDLTREAGRHISDDPELARLWSQVSREFTIRSAPEGAIVTWKPYGAPEAEWRPLGPTPLRGVRLPAGPLRLQVTADGYVPLEIAPLSTEVAVTLMRRGTPSEGMVHVPGGALRASYAGLGHIDVPQIGDFEIDRHEVTNREFKAFVEAGGYRRRELWNVPVIDTGRELSWEEAMSRFVDPTGRPGPSTWEAGSYAEGAADHPVAGVSWYEAAAYAVFVGKQLPTVYHWIHAATPDRSSHVAPLSNFSGDRALPVGRTDAVNAYGATDMAGNVREWCWNDKGGERFILGGSWADPAYMLARGQTVPALDRSSTNGFRCMRDKASSPVEALLQPVNPAPLPGYLRGAPVADDVFEVYRALYAYEDAPLDAIVESVDDRSDLWRRERVRFRAAYGQDDVIAQLFLPKHAQPPYQCVIFFPGGQAIRPGSSDEIHPETYVLRSGRALLYPVFFPTYERFAKIESTPVTIRDAALTWRKDVGRAIDYLETRSDIDASRTTFMGASWGGEFGPILLALEPRFRAAVLLSGGLTPLFGALPEINAINFLPRVRTPVLMVNGHFDSILPVAEAQKPMFELLGTPTASKRHVLVYTGHWVSAPETRTTVIREVLDWLDTHLGPP